MGETGFVYVSHITKTFVSVIDGVTNKLAGSIPADSGCGYIEISKTNNKGYICNFTANNITVFDNKTNKTIKNIEAGEHPFSCTESADGKFLYVSHQSPDGLFIINTEDLKISKKLSEGTGFIVKYKNGELYYQAQIFTPYLFVFNPKTQEFIKKVEVGGRPMNFIFSPDFKFGYIPNYDLNEVEFFDVEKDSVIFRLPGVFHARGITITPDGKYLYVTDVTDKKVYAIDIENKKIIKEIYVYAMPTSLAITPDGKYIYVSNQGALMVCIIDTKTNEKIQDIKVADNPIMVQIF
jgi:YVTN family beta-propeller protein